MTWPSPCWDPNDAVAMISFEAGSPEDAADHARGDHVFEAVHTPPTVRELTAAEFQESQEGKESSQSSVLSALGDSKPFLFVTGLPGTGKSHLVRWLHLNRSHSPGKATEVQAYIPRAMTRLRDVLRTVLEYADASVREQLERDLDTATTGLDEHAARAQLLANLALVIETRVPAIKQGSDPAFQKRAHLDIVSDLHELLRARPVREHLCRDGGSIARMVTTRLTGERSGGMSADDELRIHESDLVDLAGIKAEGIAKEAERLLSKICSDAEARRAAHELLGPAHSDPALQRLVGLSTGQLQEAMTELLASLHNSGKRLILFFEDWGLISGLQEEMAEAIASAPQGAVLAVVAITSDRLHEQRGNVLERGRIFVLDPPSGAVPWAELRRSHPGADVLAGHALNAIRWGRRELEKAYATRTNDDSWLASKCETDCPFDVKDACFDTFGSIGLDGVGEVGFFPFSEVALRNALTRKAGGGVAVPRVVLHEVIREALKPEFASQLEDGSFPSPEFAADFRPRELELNQAQINTVEGRLNELDAGDQADRAQAFLETYRSARALETFEDIQRTAFGFPEFLKSLKSPAGGVDDHGDGRDVVTPNLAQEALDLAKGGTVTAGSQLKELTAREVLVGLPAHWPIWRRHEWARDVDHRHVALEEKAKYAAGGPELRVDPSEVEALAYLAWSHAREGSWREIEGVPEARALTDTALDRWIRDATTQLFGDKAERERTVEALMRVLALTGLGAGLESELTEDNIVDVVFGSAAQDPSDQFSRICVGRGPQTVARDATREALLRRVAFAQGGGAPIAVDIDFVTGVARSILEKPGLPDNESIPDDAPEWAGVVGQEIEDAVEAQFSRVKSWWKDYGDIVGDQDEIAELINAVHTLQTRAFSAVDPLRNAPFLRTTDADVVRSLTLASSKLNETFDDPQRPSLGFLASTRAAIDQCAGRPLSERITVARDLQKSEPLRNQLTTLHLSTQELLQIIEERLPADPVKDRLDTSPLETVLDKARKSADVLGGK